MLQTYILTNGKAKGGGPGGEGLNLVFLLLNGFTGALDKKLEVNLLAPVAVGLHC